MRTNLAAISLLLISGLYINHAEAESNPNIPIATQVTINYSSSGSDLGNIDLLRTSFTQTPHGFWEPGPTPPVSIISNSTPVQTTLKTEIIYQYSGTITYGVRDYCSSELICDPNYQFTITLNQHGCFVDKTRLTGGIVEHTLEVSAKLIEDGSKMWDCIINIEAEPATLPPPPPTVAAMQLTIANQTGLTPGTGQYTYQLQNGEAIIQQGIVSPQDFMDIPVNTNPPPVVATLAGSQAEPNIYNGMIIYEFDDRVDGQGKPTVLQINLNNTSSSNINDWCTANIVNGNAGDRFYYVESVTVTGTAAEADCAVSIAVDNPPMNYKLTQVYALPTTGILQWEHFNINNQDYLSAGSSLLNIWDGNSPYNFNLFLINSNSYNSLQLVDEANCLLNGSADYQVNHPYGWKHFTINSVDRIMMMNKQADMAPIDGDCAGLSYYTKSPIYQWNGSRFNTANNYYELRTDSPVMAEFYTINNSGTTTYYLAVAESYLANISVMSVYQWNGAGFTKTTQDLSALGTNAVTDITEFTDISTGQTYLIVSQPNAQVTLFKVDNNGNLTVSSTIPVTGAKSALEFTVNNQQFLIFGYQTAPASPNVYQWQSASANFTVVQTLPSSFGNAQAWQTFSQNGEQFLVGAFGTGGAKAYYWSTKTQRLESQYQYPVQLSDCVNGNVVNLTAFEMGTTNFVALACYAANGSNQVYSPVVMWQQTTH